MKNRCCRFLIKGILVLVMTYIPLEGMAAQQFKSENIHSRVVTYQKPKGYTLMDGVEVKNIRKFDVRVNRKKVDPYVMQTGLNNNKKKTAQAAFAYFDFEGTVDVEVKTTFDFEKVVIRPLSLDIHPEIEGRTVSFKLTNPCNISIEFDGKLHENLQLFANPIETFDFGDARIDYIEPGNHLPHNLLSGVDGHAPYVIYFKPGIHILPADEIFYIPNNTTIFVAGGAVVYGRLHAEDAHNFRILGRGIVNGSKLDRRKDFGEGVESYLMRFWRCSNIEVNGIILQDSPHWTFVNIECEKVNVRNFRITGQHRDNNDGMDIVNCRNFVVDHSFVRTIDDAVTIKGKYIGGKRHKVSDIAIQNTVLWNEDAGNSIELGFETLTDQYENIVFRNIDVIHNNSCGGITIHNGDDAVMNNIVYDDIRFEDHTGNERSPFMEFYIQDTFYSTGVDRGRLEGVIFNNIHYMPMDIRHSSIRGYSEKYNIENIRFHHVQMGDKLIMSPTDARLATNEFVRSLYFTSDYYKFIPTSGDIWEVETLPYRFSDSVKTVLQKDYMAYKNTFWDVDMQTEGDWAEIEFIVEHSGCYMPSVNFRKGKEGGTFRILVDGSDLGFWVDTYNEENIWQEYLLPAVYLKAGKHVIRMVAVSKHISSAGYRLGIDYLNLRRPDDTTIEAEDLLEGIAEGSASNAYYTTLEWNADGDYDLPVNLSCERRSTLRLRLLTGPEFGKVKLSIDGKSQGECLNLHNDTIEFKEFSMGNVYLSQGTHIFTFTRTGECAPLGIDFIRFGAFPKTVKWEAVRLNWSGDVPCSEGVQTRNEKIHNMSATMNKPGDWLKYNISVPYAGKYRVVARLTGAPDKGIYRIRVNGNDYEKETDLYLPEGKVGEYELGIVPLNEGSNVFYFIATGKNEAATGYNFQFWRVTLVPVVDF